MRVLICPDKFAGTLAAPEVAAAVAEGWREADPDAEVTTIPLADGGPGMLDALAAVGLYETHEVATVDPFGRPVTGRLLQSDDTAYIESADACGLHLLTAGERDPLRATSFGLGTLIGAAIEAGCRRVVIGLGGSATNDGGAGMLIPLGLTPLDERGHALPYGGGALAACAALDGAPRLRGAALVAAADVDNPLCGLTGATSVFGRQKGADDNAVQILDHGLSVFAGVLARDVPGCPPGVADLPGSGAAGGIGAALYALGAERVSGAALVRHTVGLDAALDACDLVITGEGSFDHQSLRGKVVSDVAAAAAERGVPCTVVAGRVTVGRREAAVAGVDRSYSLVEHFGSADEAMARPADGLRELGERIARRWRR